MEKGTILENRKFVIGGIILVVVAVYIWRLASLQLISSDYQTKADSNAYYRSVVFPSRGNIYDRRGERLVYNQTAFDIMVTTREIKNLDTLEFCKAIGITRDMFDKRMEAIKDRKLNPGYASVRPQLFVGQLSENEYSVIQEKLIRYPGFSIRKRAVRKYSTPLLAHVLGDVGEVNRATSSESREWRGHTRRSSGARKGCRFCSETPGESYTDTTRTEPRMSCLRRVRTSLSASTRNCRSWENDL